MPLAPPSSPSVDFARPDSPAAGAVPAAGDGARGRPSPSALAAAAIDGGGKRLDLTGDGHRETVGYDTTGNGRVDALDTNGDGRIDARIVPVRGAAAAGGRDAPQHHRAPGASLPAGGPWREVPDALSPLAACEASSGASHIGETAPRGRLDDGVGGDSSSGRVATAERGARKQAWGAWRDALALELGEDEAILQLALQTAEEQWELRTGTRPKSGQLHLQHLIPCYEIVLASRGRVRPPPPPPPIVHMRAPYSGLHPG